MAFRGILALSLKHMERASVGDRTVIRFDKISNSVFHFVQRRECAAEPGEVYGNQPGLPREACATTLEPRCESAIFIKLHSGTSLR